MSALHPMLLGISWMDPNWLLQHFGAAFFWVSLVMIFVECGLLFPFLPGDTLLFAVGLFIGTDKVHLFGNSHWVNLALAFVTMVVAAVAGNVAGYEIGRRIGPALYERDGRIVKRRYLEETHEFFERHGNSALVIGRFVAFVRTYITLVAGITGLERRRFFTWSLLGAVLWVLVVMLLGFFLGQVFPGLGKYLDYAILAILLLSVIPVGYEWWRRRRAANA